MKIVGVGGDREDGGTVGVSWLEQGSMEERVRRHKQNWYLCFKSEKK